MAASHAPWGFEGKQCIHPAQLAAANRAFTPSSEDVGRASRLLNAYDEATTLDGRMIDAANLRMARMVLEKHRRSGGETMSCFEDLTPGMVIPHALGRTITATDNTWFTLLTMNSNPIHFDAHYSLHRVSDGRW